MRVPGKLKSSAAVAWWRKEGERQKYAGKVATYTRTEITEAVYSIALDGGRIFGMTGRSVVPMWTPRNRDAMDIDNVKETLPTPSTT
jgi:hypothetical protein